MPETSLTTTVEITADNSVPNPPSEHAEVLSDSARMRDRDRGRERVHLLTEEALAETGHGLYLSEADLSGMDLSGFDLRHAVLNRANLYGTKLINVNLTGASLICAGLERTDFTNATLKGAYLHALAAQASTFTGADLTELIDATGALFHGCNLTHTRLDNAMLAGTTFYQCSLKKAQLRGSDLRGVMFNECRMDSANLCRAVVDDATILRSNVRELNLSNARGHGLAMRRPTAADHLCLTDAHLPSLCLIGVRARALRATGLHARRIDVQDSQLPEADLSHTDLSGGRWEQVGLNRASLVGALMSDSSWQAVTAIKADVTQAVGEALTASECTFTEAVFAGYTGRYATFRNCNFRRADFRGAYLYRAAIIGDPPASACMVDAQLDGANLTQAYLAADFTGASMRHGWATYARLNQSIFDGADLQGTGLFRASAVKVEFAGTRMGGQQGAIFADRCPGLLDALRAAMDPGNKRLAELVEELTELLNRDSGKST